MSDYSTNGSVAPLIPGDSYLSQGVYTGDVHIDGNTEIGSVNATVPAPITVRFGTGSQTGTVCSVLIGDVLGKVGFFQGTTSTAVVQQGTTIASASVTGTDAVYATVGGYTLGQIVTALKAYNLLD